jgi:hypothetical protein
MAQEQHQQQEEAFWAVVANLLPVPHMTPLSQCTQQFHRLSNISHEVAQNSCLVQTKRHPSVFRNLRTGDSYAATFKAQKKAKAKGLALEPFLFESWLLGPEGMFGYAVFGCFYFRTDEGQRAQNASLINLHPMK